MNQALFAAGCFWGVQFYFDQVPGVVNTEVGYCGGSVENPTYEQVCTQTTGHAEAVRIEFDPTVVHFETLVQQFLYMHDPTQEGGQGPDIGDGYRSAIFYTTDEQRQIAERVIQTAAGSYKKPIVTKIEAATTFWPAEAYHQKFAERTGRGMCHKPFKQL